MNVFLACAALSLLVAGFCVGLSVAPCPKCEPYIGATQEQRTWADLFAACQATDSWLGADVDGKPTCYPMGQGEGRQ